MTIGKSMDQEVCLILGQVSLSFSPGRISVIRERPFRGESNIDFLGESKGSLPQPQRLTSGEAINDFWSMSGSFIYRHHVEPRVNEGKTVFASFMDLCHPKNSELEPQFENYKGRVVLGSDTVTSPELLIRIWMSSKRSASMIFEISMGQEICLILGQGSHNVLYWNKKLLTDICGPGEIDEKTAYIQARSSMARTLEINGKARQAEGEAKVV